MQQFTGSVYALLLCLLVVACDSDRHQQPVDYNGQNNDRDNTLEETGPAPVAMPWPKAIRELTGELLEQSRNLKNAIDTFLLAPDSEGLKALQQQWLGALLKAQQLQPWLYLLQPGELESLRENILHWPFYPGFVDSHGAYRNSGMVNTIDLALTKRSLRQQHQRFDDDELSLGLWPLGYLLWGDQGKRNAEDFVAVNTVPSALAAEGIELDDINRNRRRQLLQLMVTALVDDITVLDRLWQQKQTFFADLQLADRQAAAELFRLSLLAYGLKVQQSLAELATENEEQSEGQSQEQGEADTDLQPFQDFWLQAVNSANTGLAQLLFEEGTTGDRVLWPPAQSDDIRQQMQAISAAMQTGVKQNQSSAWGNWVLALKQ